MRAHVSLPKELIEEIDEFTGPRQRSRFIEEAIRLKLLNERQKRALAHPGPPLDPKKYPSWATPEKTSQWVRESRQRDNARLDRKLRNLPS